MKKFIITIAPLWLLMFFLLWFSWGLEGVLAFFTAIVFLAILSKGISMWIEFVDKHFD